LKIKDYYKSKYYIHYSNCHEDANMVLRYANNPKIVLSIASGLDNSLAMLCLNPDRVVCVDNNPAQIYLCNLKKIGIKYLSYDEFRVLIGIDDGDSYGMYLKIRDCLDSDTRSYFDEFPFLISEVKIVNAGRFEYYFQVFKNKVLKLIHSKKTIDGFMNCSDILKQRYFYENKFNNFRFKLLFKLFFSKFVMKKIGRDKDYFKYNKGDLSLLLKKRFELGIYHNLNKDNPYLQYVIYNEYKKLPYYLEEDNFNKIKTNIDKLEIRLCEFEDALDIKYDYMNLSDIFEYMSVRKTNELSFKIYDCLNDKGRVIFWNMQNDRKFGYKFNRVLVDLKEDLCFYYKDILVYEK